MKKSGFGCIVALTALLALLIVTGAFYTVNETEQVIVTQFLRASHPRMGRHHHGDADEG